MNDIAIYTLTSFLHDETAVNAVTKEFLASLQTDVQLIGNDYSTFGDHALNLIYVRTGGTEGIFLKLLPELLKRYQRPFYLLTSGKSNSLAASLEILSYLQNQGLRGEVIHGTPAYIRHRIEMLHHIHTAISQLHGQHYGIVGQPSDWLISSQADPEAVHRRLGITLDEIPMQRLAKLLEGVDIPAGKEGAVRLYEAMKQLVLDADIQGFTIRCFDLLTSLHNTGCLGLAQLNSEGYVAGCEGDVPAMLTMIISRALFGISGFQSNPSRIDTETGEILLAHCTIPFNMVTRYEMDTHFESGIGVGIRGYMKEGPVTLFKVSGDLSRHFIAEGTLLHNGNQPDLCRTQLTIRLDNPSDAHYFLRRPIGNHHIVLPGHVGQTLEAFMQAIAD